MIFIYRIVDCQYHIGVFGIVYVRGYDESYLIDHRLSIWTPRLVVLHGDFAKTCQLYRTDRQKPMTSRTVFAE